MTVEVNMDWYEWHPRLYREATLHLSCEEDGMYRRLIDHYMETRKPLVANENALSRICGTDIDSFKRAISKLQAFFVLAESEGKAVWTHDFCDKLLNRQDELSVFRSDRARKAALARHNLSLKNKDNPATSKPQAMLGDAKETVNSKQDIDKSISKNHVYSDEFEQFWKFYPNPINKANAYKSYKQALKETNHGTIINGAIAYAEYVRSSATEKRFVCHAATWLNQQRWTNDYKDMDIGASSTRSHNQPPKRGLAALEASADKIFQKAGGFMD